MPKKPKPVTLASSWGAAREDATPERLRHAAAHGSADLDTKGTRRIGDPFDLLHARGLLDRHSPEQNALLWQAGTKFRNHWHLAHLDPLTAFDFSRVHVDTSGDAQAAGLTEAAVRHRDAVRAATVAIGPRLMPFVTAVVVDARPIAALRSAVTDTAHARTADALSLERLREGLHRLCELWSMHPNTRPRRIVAWHGMPQDA